jgi:hypothetical protein
LKFDFCDLELICNFVLGDWSLSRCIPSYSKYPG